MAKWCAIGLIVSAVAVRIFWSSSFDLSFPAGSTGRRAYPASSVLFWILIVSGVAVASIELYRRIR